MAPAKIVLNLTPFPANLAYFYLCGLDSDPQHCFLGAPLSLLMPLVVFLPCACFAAPRLCSSIFAKYTLYAAIETARALLPTPGVIMFHSFVSNVMLSTRN